MHVLADTWAHRYFAGTPSLVINNTNYHFYEIMPDNSERAVKFRHSPSAPDDLEQGIYTNSIYQGNENSIMNLGHGRAGHLPDYSFMRYRYLPAWGDYEEVVKDNPTEYYCAFCQMIRAMQYLRGEKDRFAKEEYAWKQPARGKRKSDRFSASGDRMPVTTGRLSVRKSAERQQSLSSLKSIRKNT